MKTWEGKHFSITDPKGVNTVIYQVNKTEIWKEMYFPNDIVWM